MLKAIFDVLRSSCAWRLVPHDVQPWRTVYHACRLWRLQGLWETLHTWRRAAVRVLAGRAPQPSAAILASQSVTTTTVRGLRDYDSGKNVTGCTRPLLVDTQGRIL